ncbi:hypothetical protein LTR37_011461 [Vermiconidia calcicola]|uniref:Uncharacterized protein n=1 Tax=Vermiconidia calcicola TaxID=1690605 RepID=A0ACC3N257_9PEZI|nr:hypothetical protein LTR37_011461 [Vermiconidia calcicola]
MERSPFEKLSAELRNTIYAMVVYEPCEIRFDWREADDAWVTSEPGPLRGSGLTETCKQIREECLPMMFSMNCFTFRTSILGDSEELLDEQNVVGRLSLVTNKLKTALNSMGRGVADIRTIEIGLGCWNLIDGSMREIIMYGTITKLKQVLSVTEANVVAVFEVVWDAGWTGGEYKLLDLALPLSNRERAEHEVRRVLYSIRKELKSYIKRSGHDPTSNLDYFEACLYDLLDLLY